MITKCEEQKGAVAAREEDASETTASTHDPQSQNSAFLS